MGGIPIHITGYDVTKPSFEIAVEAFRNEVQRLEAKLSTYRANSLITRVNEQPSRSHVVSGDIAKMLSEGLAIGSETGGAFDFTVGPLIDLWREAAKSGEPPPEEALQRARGMVGPNHVKLREIDGVYELRVSPGTRLDVGGIAKGYFADLGVELLRSRGLKRAVVELGGDLRAFDDRPDPKPFRIGVRHPKKESQLLGYADISSGSLVTSGSNARFFTIGEERYSHIIDPRTGRPAEGLMSVTLLGPTGLRADALATAVSVMGEKAGMAFVEQTADVEAVFVIKEDEDPRGFRIWMSSGLRGRVHWR